MARSAVGGASIGLSRRVALVRLHEERDLAALVIETTRLIAARRSRDVVMHRDGAQVRIGDSIFGRRLPGEFDFDLDEQK